MNRRVPEFALVTGLLLALSFGGFSLWATRDVSRSVLAGVILLYPFALYAVRHDDDPTTVLPPRAVGAGGALLLVVLAADATVAAPDDRIAVALLRGVWYGLLAALPAVAYAVRYGPNGAGRADGSADARAGRTPGAARAGRAALAGSVLVGAALLAAGLAVDTGFGPAAGLLVVLAGGLYAHGRGVRPGRTAKLAGVAAGLLAAAAALVAGLSADAPDTYVLAAIALVLTPAVYYALTVETSAF